MDFINIYNPTQKPYTLASRTSQRLNQNLPISMSLPTHERNETCCKFERKNDK